MSYLVLARKWRPQTFGDLIGQEHVNQTLKNAMESGRIAHAFLFTGSRGVGKTSAARILAKSLNCEHGPSAEPCNECSICTEITAGTSVDVLEIDGASNTGVDDIRELRETVKYLPSRCRYRIIIIDEVHMLSNSAFNALLKTLEEPPAHVKFIFATTEPHKLPITILSRCQRFDFKRISLSMIMGRLRYILDREQVAISDEALAIIARKGDGSMRDSLSTLDQVLAFCGDNVTDEDVVSILGVVDRRLLSAASRGVFAGDCAALLDIVRQVDLFGCNMRHFCQELIDHFRSMAIIKAVGDGADPGNLSDGERSALKELSSEVELETLQRHLAILLKAEAEMAHSGFARLILEMALLKMAKLPPALPVSVILEQLKALQDRGAGSGVASSRPIWEAAPPAAGPKPPPAPGPETKTAAPGPAPAAAPSSASPPGGDLWTGFVAHVRERKMGLSSLLEHARPLKVSPESLEIGLEEGSYYYKTLKEPDYFDSLKSFVTGYFRAETAIRLVPLSRSKQAGDLPPTLVEKKKIEDSDRILKLQEKAMKHPLVAAALKVFAGKMTEVTPVEPVTP